MAYGNGGSVNQALQGALVKGYDVPMGEAPRPVGLVGKHAAELHQILAEVSNRVDALERTLSPVLTPDPPSTNSNTASGSAPTPIRSSVADSLAMAGEMAVQLIHRLERLTSRVEL